MKKEDLKKYIRDGELKTLALLLLRISNSLKKKELKNIIDQTTARYNRLTNTKMKGEISRGVKIVEIKYRFILVNVV